MDLKIDIRTTIVLLLFYCANVTSIVTLRPKNERVAWESGVECLEEVQKIFHRMRVVLEDSEEANNVPIRPSTKNVIMQHLHNLTSPAAEIERHYLQQVHGLVSSGEMKSQLRVVSDNYPVDALLNVPFNVISTPDFYVLITDDVDKLFTAMKETISRASSWNPSAKFVILFNNIDHRHQMGKWEVSRFFQEMAIRFHVNHFLLLFAKSSRTYDIYVSKIFRSDDAGKCVPMMAHKVTKCEDGKISSVAEFEKEIAKAAVPKYMPQCTFTACASTAQPFVSKSCRSGLEILLVKFIANYLNFNLSVRCSKKPRGEVAEDGSLSNLLLDLRQDKCDFIIGSMYPDNEIHMHFKSSLAYYEDSYTWFVPMASKRAPWKGLVYIFKLPTWCFIGFVLLLCSLVWNLVSIVSKDRRRFKKFGTCFLNNWSTLLGISVPLQPLKTPLRILFMAITLYSLNMTTIYTSNLIAVFTEPAFDPQMATVEEVLRTGINLGGREEYKDWFETGYEVDEQISRRYNTSDEFQPSVENLDRVRQGHQVMLLSRLFVVSRNYSNLVYGLSTNVFANQMEIIFEKGFPLVNLFDKVINGVKDNGIIYKFFNDWHAKMAKNNAIVEEQTEIILTVRHLEGAFAFLVYGLIVSSVVFMFEVLFNRYCKMKIQRIKLIYGYYVILKYPVIIWKKKNIA